MRKKTLLFLAISLFTVNVWGQTITNVFPDDGNVGIGDNTPAAKLEILSSGAVYHGTPSLLVRDISYRGTMFLESVTDNATDFVFKNNNRYSWAMSTRASSENYSLKFYPSINGTNWNSATLTLLTNGNVGIGTSSPDFKLQIENNVAGDGGWASGINIKSTNSTTGEAAISFNNTATSTNHWIMGLNQNDKYRIAYGSSFTDTNTKFTLDNNGNIGIGTINPTFKLQLEHDAAGDGGWTSGINIKSTNSTTGEAAISFNNTAKSTNHWITVLNQNDKYRIAYGSSFTDANTKFTLDNNGNIGIGTTSPQYKLAVKGTIGCGEIKVENVSGWADFVFEPNYNLKTLSELETYIQENNHLPEIPTAEEVEKNGVSLGEMDAKLLQKIEELTLYVISMNKEIEELKEKNKELEEKISK